jgi:hypothetical protein
MKFLKNTLTIAAFFAMSSVCAKQMGGKVTTTTTKAQVVQAPAAIESYRDLFDKVKSMKASEVVDKSGQRLSGQFVKKIIDDIASSDEVLGEDSLEAILQAARDIYVPFTGNNAKDLTILANLKEQIWYAKQALKTALQAL